jgi:hypothetical protein
VIASCLFATASAHPRASERYSLRADGAWVRVSRGPLRETTRRRYYARVMHPRIMHAVFIWLASESMIMAVSWLLGRVFSQFASIARFARRFARSIEILYRLIGKRVISPSNLLVLTRLRRRSLAVFTLMPVSGNRSIGFY